MLNEFSLFFVYYQGSSDIRRALVSYVPMILFSNMTKGKNIFYQKDMEERLIGLFKGTCFIQPLALVLGLLSSLFPESTLHHVFRGVFFGVLLKTLVFDIFYKEMQRTNKVFHKCGVVALGSLIGLLIN